jgi:hypothetical protein
MAVPISGITLQDVIDEINPTTDDLVDCIADADSAKFDATYYTAPATSLLEFRNYGAVCVAGLTGVPFYPTATSSGSACSPVGGESTRYHDGVGGYPTNGDKIYVDLAGCTVMNGGGSWFADRNGGTFHKMQISSTGIVSNYSTCP